MPRKDWDALSRMGQELAVRYAEGDEEAAEELYRTTHRLIARYISKLAWNARSSLAWEPRGKSEEDIFQSAMLRIFRALKNKKYRREDKYRLWVRKIVFRTVIDEMGLRGGKQRWRPGWVHLDEVRDDGEKDRPAPAASLGSAPEQEARLLEKEVLNLILEGLRRLPNEAHGMVFAARTFVGKNVEEVALLFDLKQDTVKSHFRRAGQGILDYVRSHADYAGLSLEGLRGLAFARFALAEADLELVRDKRLRAALALAAEGPTTPTAYAARLGLPPGEAVRVLREAVTALSRARLRRVRPPPAVGTASGAWLWKVSERALGAFPSPPARTRAVKAADPELGALAEVAVFLGMSAMGREPARSLGEILAAKVPPAKLRETARKLRLKETELLQMIANTAPPELVKRALRGAAKLCGLSSAQARAAAAEAGRHRPHGTRGKAPGGNFVRRVMNQAIARS